VGHRPGEPLRPRPGRRRLYYLADKAHDLARRAERLADTAGQIAQAVRDDRPGPRPRRQAVRAAVAFHGRHYRAGRLLHPQPEEA
jgi:hypothetical protein